MNSDRENMENVLLEVQKNIQELHKEIQDMAQKQKQQVVLESDLKRLIDDIQIGFNVLRVM